MSVRALPAGDRAVLLEVADNAQAQALARGIRLRLHDAIEDVVVGHRTVLVSWSGARPHAAWDDLVAAGCDGAGARAAPDVVLPVRYDGPDLEAVAAHAACSPEEVVRRHRQARYTVAFIGFSPGFAYLIGGDPVLDVPRRADPRTRVPAGSVAVAGPYTAAYPADSPGGWHLIGTTPATLFDPTGRAPALLQAGATVTIRDITGSP